MNIVDIDCWNILVRHGQTVKSFTKDDAPELFEEFRFRGLITSISLLPTV